MASQSSIIACGPRMTMVAIGLKVVVGPGLMTVASLLIGLRCTLFKVAIVQVIFPFIFIFFYFSGCLKVNSLHDYDLACGRQLYLKELFLLFLPKNIMFILPF